MLDGADDRPHNSPHSDAHRAALTKRDRHHVTFNQ
ncbi:hypothetical protein [Enterobacter phage vB_ExiM_F5M1E]|nr:hypothetical protein [Enterobacter phage vB_ExiM_F1M1E]UNA03073.1 hypothetical protein [Enterobacter phage vB_ExiM_F2M1E]UNA03394.1 hypothetical protein [Enterobacter phage vB_ExiM_F4M1E]UNA03715.1 hypothetical protein [Enterobacter phage vB_ExiM_F5M1E]UNA04035.1 hypothetical protein [Pantoea phage vB_PdiM_F5M2A]